MSNKSSKKATPKSTKIIKGKTNKYSNKSKSPIYVEGSQLESYIQSYSSRNEESEESKVMTKQKMKSHARRRSSTEGVSEFTLNADKKRHNKQTQIDD